MKLVIEIDGEQHYTESGMPHDTERSMILAGYGIEVIRFTSQEVMNEFEGVCDRIARSIGVSDVG